MLHSDQVIIDATQVLGNNLFAIGNKIQTNTKTWKMKL